VAAYQGCPVPDKDNDGIPDDQDECPDVAGVALYHGCPVPDTDKDGIKDDVDKCPTVPGLAKYDGCPAPDADKDGIPDDEDKCPNVAGVAKYNGCPIPDTDGDGVNDEEDKCPTVAGAKENNGCPVIKKETIAKVEKAAKNIYFQSGKAVILAASNAQLNEVVKVLKADTTLNIAINGHTDNTGKAEANLKVSQQRADAVKAYFVKKGIAASRIAATGYGDTKPIASNTTVAGRQKNRRVELTLRNY
jgi:outer membrane protein OmpA-like peptidoglycan-associated protein